MSAHFCSSDGVSVRRKCPVGAVQSATHVFSRCMLHWIENHSFLDGQDGITPRRQRTSEWSRITVSATLTSRSSSPACSGTMKSSSVLPAAYVDCITNCSCLQLDSWSRSSSRTLPLPGQLKSPQSLTLTALWLLVKNVRTRCDLWRRSGMYSNGLNNQRSIIDTDWLSMIWWQLHLLGECWPIYHGMRHIMTNIPRHVTQMTSWCDVQFDSLRIIHIIFVLVTSVTSKWWSLIILRIKAALFTAVVRL